MYFKFHIVFFILIKVFVNKRAIVLISILFKLDSFILYINPAFFPYKYYF